MKYLFLVVLLLSAQAALALKFPEPPVGSNIVGKTQTVVLKNEDDYSSIAQKFDLGYYEIFEANVGIDPDTVAGNTLLILPTEYVLPPELKPDSIVVNIAEMRLYYWSTATHEIFIFPIGIGKEDWITPVGNYSVVQKIRHPVWTPPKSVFDFRKEHGDPVPKAVPPGADNPLGDYALRLSKWNYLIHGSNDPLGIGRRSSAGCIRLYEQDIELLFSMAIVGTKVFIINEPYKIGVRGHNVYLEAHMPLYEQRVAMKGDLTAVNKLADAFTSDGKSYIDKLKLTTVAKEHVGVPRVVGVVKNFL
jgi:L,D-transpeptidase ErfK/SrfK